MRRHLAELAERVYDVAVVGGGIYGASVSRDAALRGLSVTLVERDDFGGATSGNSLGIVHGGLRYLRQANLERMRHSIRERTALLKIAPHLVEPLPVLIPTYAGRRPGRALLAAALAVSDLLSAGRNRGLDLDRRIPAGRVVSPRECVALFPGIDEAGPTGGVVFHDARMTHPDRLTLAVVRSAVEAGAVAANHAEVTGFLGPPDRVEGLRVVDRLGGERIEVRARVVVNAAGPWVDALLARLAGRRCAPAWPLARAMNLVLRRRLTAGCAVGLASRRRRLVFLVPWQDGSAIGTFYAPYGGDPDRFGPLTAEVARVFEEIGGLLPAARLGAGDVSLVQAGLLPCDGAGEPVEEGGVRLATRYRIHDHAREAGVEGLVSVVGVKYTTARGVAEEAVDLVFRKLGRRPPPASTAVRPVHGGAIGRLDAFAAGVLAARPRGLAPDALLRLVETHGAAYLEVLALLDESPALGALLPDGVPVLRAAVVYAVREEMAVTLADVVRRTGLAAAGQPADEALATCAALAAAELRWDARRTEQELAAVRVAPGGWPLSSTAPRR